MCFTQGRAVLLVAYLHILYSDCCYIADCPGKDYYIGKRILPEMFSAINKTGSSQDHLLERGIAECLDDPRALISKRCDFYGTKLCCQLEDNYGDIACDVTSSSNEDASEMRGMLEAAEIRMKKLIFQRGTPPGGKYCLKMGICCVKDRCKLDLSCSAVTSSVEEKHSGLPLLLSKLLDGAQSY
ncbi:unnamed protein product [Clavelina lepadiformis]|uniref:Uncharacterized protein n=1 Tax=Clavelina lepadiformis TaxID=159417 RepID=A0ABP0GZU9_CLALP